MLEDSILGIGENDIVFDIVIEAGVVSKKNQYRQTKSGRRFKPKEIVETEYLAISQIPEEFKGLMLTHPVVEFQAYVPKKNWALDIDGLFTTITDYLVKAKVLAEDNIRNFNGLKILYPVKESDRKRFEIRLRQNA